MIISVNKHSVDPDQTPLCAAFELDLHSLHMTPKQVSGPEVIIFLMLNSAEYEILNTHKYKNRRKFSTFGLI